MRIVALDSFATDQGAPDAFWGPLKALGEVVLHPRTAPGDVLARCQGAGAVLTNKVALGAAQLAALPELRYVGVVATGTNVIDLEAGREFRRLVLDAGGAGGRPGFPHACAAGAAGGGAGARRRGGAARPADARHARDGGRAFSAGDAPGRDPDQHGAGRPGRRGRAGTGAGTGPAARRGPGRAVGRTAARESSADPRRRRRVPPRGHLASYRLGYLRGGARVGPGGVRQPGGLSRGTAAQPRGLTAGRAVRTVTNHLLRQRGRGDTAAGGNPRAKGGIV